MRVSYRYAGYAKNVLHDIDLRLDDGEIVGVVGANEAGKSTLCLVASGLAPGSIGGGLTARSRSNGESMAGKPLYEFATRVGIGFQNPTNQLSGVTGTVFEEVALGPMNLGRAAREMVARIKTTLAMLDIGTLAEREPRRLSGGQAQLVVIASLLAMRTGPPRPRRADGPARSRRDTTRGRRAPRPGSERNHDARASSTRPTCSERAVQPASWSSTTAGSHSTGPPHEVLADSRLETWGVEAPSRGSG